MGRRVRGASLLLALLFGVAFGNVVRGVPVDRSREFTMPFFTHFGTTGQVGLLDYYSLSVGLLAVALLSAHGAAFLAWRTAGAVRERCLLLERKLWPAVAVLFAIVTLETYFVRLDLVTNLLTRPPRLAGRSAGNRRQRGAGQLAPAGPWMVRAFLGSCALIAGVLSAAGAALFPVFLRSTLSPAFDLDALHQPAQLDRHEIRARLVAVRVHARRVLFRERLSSQSRACQRGRLLNQLLKRPIFASYTSFPSFGSFSAI